MSKLIKAVVFSMMLQCLIAEWLAEPLPLGQDEFETTNLVRLAEGHMELGNWTRAEAFLHQALDVTDKLTVQAVRRTLDSLES